MKKAALLLTLLCLSLPAVASAGEADKKGCADHPAFPKRMSGYFISDCQTKDFDAFAFETGKPRQKTTVEGRWTKITYRMYKDSQQPSALAVVRGAISRSWC